MRFLCAVVAWFLVTPVDAAPFAVQLGDTRIGLDSPPGFSDTTFTGSPRLLELAETLTSASNRILLFAISDADMRRFNVGDTPEYRRYMIGVTPKGLERDRVSATAFNAFVSDALRELGPPSPDADYAKFLDAQALNKADRKSTRLNSSHIQKSRMPSSA